MADVPPFRIAIIAGEESGDQLGADLVAALRRKLVRPVEVVGTGGSALAALGQQSWFDPAEIALMGFTEVIGKLPRLLSLIRRTANDVVAANPDCLVIVDNPDFTQRVARRVKGKLPALPVVNYVAPSVWAWRPGRAKEMAAYIDHVLAILPFEPKVIGELGGPSTTYVGHPLASSDTMKKVRSTQETRSRSRNGGTLLLLPGSRRGEIERHMPILKEVAERLQAVPGDFEIVIPAVGHLAGAIRTHVTSWTVPASVVTGEEAKWNAFAQAEAAVAASGTVLLELALAGVPAISIYKTDIIARAAIGMIATWSGALPNLVAGHPVIPEYYNQYIIPERIAREVARLGLDTPERFAQLASFQQVRTTMSVPKPAGESAARIVMRLAGVDT